MHLPDVFKVGYTTATPRERVKGLNTEQRNRTSQIGFFKLVISRPVIDAYGAEQKLFAAIAQYRVSTVSYTHLDVYKRQDLVRPV